MRNRFNGNYIVDSPDGLVDDSSDLFCALPTSLNGWPPRPFQIVSLYEMFQFFAGTFYQSLRNLRDFEKEIKGVDVTGNPYLTKYQIERTHTILEDLKYERKNAPPILNRILDGPLCSELLGVMPDFPCSMHLVELSGQLTALRKAVEHELWMNVFMFIPADQASFYEGNRVSGYRIKHHVSVAPPDAELLFGQRVHDNFPGARDDINEAGNCYATGRNTACAFHLTRVLERGLFVLAQDDRLFALTQNPTLTVGVHDAVMETWETLINKVESAITNLQRVGRTGQKVRALDLYSGAALHFRYFKDHWRNPISHSRASYDEPQAHSGMTKVREFMRYLAENIALEEKPGMILP